MTKTIFISGCIMLVMALAYPVFSGDSGREGEHPMYDDHIETGEHWKDHGMDGNLSQDQPNHRVGSGMVAPMSNGGRGYDYHHMEDNHSSMGHGPHMDGYHGQHLGGYGSGGCH